MPGGLEYRLDWATAAPESSGGPLPNKAFIRESA